jgi:calcium channel MID1
MQPHLLATRPAAASEASLFRLFAYTMLLAPHQAWADDIDFRSPLDPLLRRNDIFQPSYEPDFAAFGRSIIGRAPGEVIAPLRNNHIERMNLDFGTSACYLLEESTLFGQMSANQELRIRSDGENIGGSRPSPWERQDQSKRVYFSANTCLQPHKPGDSKAPAQLKLLVSQGEGAGCPMGTDGLGDDDWIAFEDGAAMLSVEARGDVYVSVLAPPLEEGYQDVYNFELAASVDDYFHSSDLEAESGRVTTNLLWMDSDSSAALLVTRNLTDDHNEAQEVMDRGAPYELFVENDEWPVFDGIRRSVCGMRNTALIWANKDNNGRQNELVHTTMTLRGAGSLPKQEFYFEGLNATSSYNVVLVRMADVSNNTRRDVDQVRGGGIVSAQMQFKTLTGMFQYCSRVIDMVSAS